MKQQTAKLSHKQPSLALPNAHNAEDQRTVLIKSKNTTDFY